MTLRENRLYQFEFRRSPSRFYPDVIRACRTIPGFAEGDRNVISLTPLTLRVHLRAVAWVYEVTRKWKDCQVYIDDVPLDQGEKLNFLRVIRCLKQRDEHPTPEVYCARDYPIGETWGCHLLTAVDLLPTIDPRRQWWYEFAVPNRNGGWSIDKVAIAGVVEREVRQKQVDICPAFAEQFIAQSIKQLPDEIDADRLAAEQERSNFHLHYVDPAKGVSEGVVVPLNAPPFRKPTPD